MIRLKKTNLKVIPTSARWSRSESDFLGRTVCELRPGFGGSTLVTSNYYDTAGNLVSAISLSTRSTRSTRLNSQLYFYNELNERIATIDDRNFNEIIDWAGPDLISSNATRYVKLNGDWWRETRQWSIHDDDSAVARLMGVHRSRITGLGVDNLASERVTINQRGNETISRNFCNRDAAEEIAWIKYSTSTTPAVTVSTNGVFAESYEYDALGRRASTTTLEGTTRHVYDANWQVIADLDEQDNVIASYIWGDGIDNLLAVKIGGASYCPLTDIQGTVWGYVDSQNNVVARWQYDAWGNVLDEEVAVSALANIRYRFQCREWSAATGLINFRMRWYDPATGRWLSKDPIGLSGGLNLYVFCGNNVLIVTDPQGCVGLAGLGAGIAAAGAVAWVGYKIWNRAKCADDEMKCRDSGDLRDVVDGAINVIKGLLGDIASPFGSFPDATSPITDKLGGALVKPIVDQLPLPSPSPKRPSGDEQIRPLP